MTYELKNSFTGLSNKSKLYMKIKIPFLCLCHCLAWHWMTMDSLGFELFIGLHSQNFSMFWGHWGLLYLVFSLIFCHSGWTLSAFINQQVKFIYKWIKSRTSINNVCEFMDMLNIINKVFFKFWCEASISHFHSSLFYYFLFVGY